ncbi:hypothetical protein BGZ83_004911 [Gryganskiella cystojenkinii]|nr:hypothetical protein BGZ83_004911 [Gryganskiella cystojenkinii]
MSSSSAHSTKTTRSSSIGSLDDRLLAHRFFHIVDARNWKQVEVFHQYRDVNTSAQMHADIYKADLERISVHDGVPEPLRKMTSNLVKNFKTTNLWTNSQRLLTNVGERRTNAGVRSLLFNVTGNVGISGLHTMAGAVRHRKQKAECKQVKRPDIRQGIMDDSGAMMFETGYGEIKSGHHVSDPEKSAPVARDLVRVGLLMKDELDAAEDLYDVTTALALGMQVIGYTSWRQPPQAARRGIRPLTDAINTGQKGPPQIYFLTTTSPDAKSIKNK